MSVMLLLIACLAAQAGEDVDRWIAQLADPDVTVREDATAKIVKAGAATAKERVRALLASKGAELHARARAILDAWPPEYTLAFEKESLERCAVAPDGSAVACCDAEGNFVVADAATGKSRFTIDNSLMPKWPPKGETWGRSAPQWTAGGLLAEVQDETLHIIDVATGKTGARLAGRDQMPPGFEGRMRLEAAQFATTGDGVVQIERELFVWYAKNSKAYGLPLARAGVISPDAELIVGICPSARETEVLQFAGCGSWRSRRVATLKEKLDLIVAPADLKRATLACTGRNVLVQIDPATCAERARVELGDAKVSTLAVRPDGKRLLVGADDKAIHFYDEATLRFVGKLDVGAKPEYVASSDDGAVIAVIVEKRVRVYRRK